MVDTFKMMNQIRLKKLANVAEEHLLNSNEDCSIVVAEIYCRHFKMWLSIANKPKFAYIDKSDKASYVLQGIYDAVNSFDVTKQVAFMTFAHKCVYNALVGALIKENSYGGWKRKEDISLDALLFDTEKGSDEQHLNLFCDDCFNGADLIQLINSDMFTEREKLVCKAILNDPYISDVELSDIIKAHRHTIRTTKLNIRQKFVLLYNSL